MASEEHAAKSPDAGWKVRSAGEGGGGDDSGLVLSVSWEAYVIACQHHQPGAKRDGGR